FLRPLFRQDWVVYAKPPFGGPEHVLHYLARYTHRVAISNHRLVNVTDDGVTFRWKDYAHGTRIKTMTVSTEEFLRRLCLHVLPRGFVRIRFYGFLAARRRAHDLPLCRRLLVARALRAQLTRADNTVRQASWPCPRCGGGVAVDERATAPGRDWAMAPKRGRPGPPLSPGRPRPVVRYAPTTRAPEVSLHEPVHHRPHRRTRSRRLGQRPGAVCNSPS